MVVARVHSSLVFTFWSTRETFITASLKTPLDMFTSTRMHTHLQSIDKGLRVSVGCSYSGVCRCYRELNVFSNGVQAFITEALFISDHVLSITLWIFLPHWLVIAYKREWCWDLLWDRLIKIHPCEVAFTDMSVVVKLSEITHKQLPSEHFTRANAPQHDFRESVVLVVWGQIL